MSVAIPIPLLQNLPDVNVMLGACVDGYSLVYEYSSNHFELRDLRFLAEATPWTVGSSLVSSRSYIISS